MPPKNGNSLRGCLETRGTEIRFVCSPGFSRHLLPPKGGTTNQGAFLNTLSTPSERVARKREAKN